MTQLFLDNEECHFFYDTSVIGKYQNVGTYINEMVDNAIGSEALGVALFNANPVFTENNIDQEFFVKNYLAIIDAYRSTGTFDSYYYLIKSVLGEGSTVNFAVDNAGHLKINVVAQSYPYGVIDDQDRGILATPDTDNIDRQLVANSTVETKTVEQLQLVLSLLNPAGIFVEFNLTQDEVLL